MRPASLTSLNSVEDTQCEEEIREVERCFRRALFRACPTLRWVTAETVRSSGVARHPNVYEAMQSGLCDAELLANALLANTQLTPNTQQHTRLKRELEVQLSFIRRL